MAMFIGRACSIKQGTRPLTVNPLTVGGVFPVGNRLTAPARSGSNFHRRLMKKAELENVVKQYATENTKRSDRAYVWGYAAVGALGIKSFLRPENGKRPRRIQMTPYRLRLFDEIGIKAHAVGCGYGFTLFLCQTEDSHVAYGCGINLNSQLGFQEYPRNTGRILDYVIEPAPVELPLSNPKTTKLTHVGCGRAHAIIATDKEGLFTLGNNALGQCGRPIVEKEKYWASHIINKLDFDKKVAQLECGQDHTLVLTDEGEVYSCGLASDGQTGHGHFNISCELKKINGDIQGEKIVNLSSRSDTVLAVSDKGDVFGWGNTEYNQFEIICKEATQVPEPRHLPFSDVGKVIKVAAGGTICGLVNDKGDIYTWGFGLLGLGPQAESAKRPTLLPPTLFGRNEFKPDSKVVDIKTGMHSLVAFTGEGGLYGWGRNKSANLGLGHNLDQYFPIRILVPADTKQVACGVDHTVALCKSHA